MFDEKIDNEQDKSIVIPLLPLRDVVMFPHMIVPLFVGREKSIAALRKKHLHGCPEECQR